MSADAEWRWADPHGQQRLVRLDELRAALVSGVIPPNAPVWRRGWTEWVAASDVPELMSQAIAAANGIVPNIPPPPLFVVAAQSEFESHTPKRQQSIYEEPPAPPPYVPLATPSSQSNLQGSSPNSRSADSVNRLKTAKKQTMLGMAAQSPQPGPVAAAIVASAQTGSSGSDQLKRALPQDAPPSSRFGADQTGSKPLQNLPTVVGVPAIADPRANTKIETPFYGAIRTEKKSDPPARPPSARPPPLEPMLKRPTLILYGGAPQEEEQGPTSNAPTAPPIVATAPGAPAGKNAVTQAPPWDKGAVELGPEIPKNARTPRMPSESEDDISESLFIEATDSGPKLIGKSQPPPAPKKASSIPPPFRPKSMPPPHLGQTAGRASGPPGPGMHAIPSAGRTKRPPPFVPNHTPSFTIGDPNAPVAEVPHFEPDPAATTNQLPAATDNDADATSHYQPPVLENQSFLVHLNPLIAKFPKLAPTRDRLAKFEEGKPKFLLPILAGITAFVGLIFFVVIVKSIFVAIFGRGDEMTTTTKPDASASSSAVASTSAAPTTSTSVVTPPPPPTTTAVAANRPPCAVVGNPRTIAPKALVPTGVEVVAATNSILVGFASGPKDGAALAINPGNLAINGQTKTKSSDPLKRVEPLPADGRPQVSPNTDKKGDPLTGRRTVPSSPGYDLGVAEGALAWAPRGTEKISPLWPLNGSGAVEALRGAPLDGGGGIAVAYRRSGAIWIGVATGDRTLSAGNLSSTQGLGPQVGSPAIAASGNSILAIWADRANASDAWGLRWQRWKIGDAPTAAEEFTPPAGGPGAPFMSPGVASLGGGRFLIVWTEGSGQGHQVRALTIGADGQAQGLPLTISADGQNAGQGQAAVTADGRGVVAYLVSAGAKTFQVSATSITCPK